MKLSLIRFRNVRGAVIGRLYQEKFDCRGNLVDREHICDTVEREGGNVSPGEYLVSVAKCRVHQRKMLFLSPLPSALPVSKQSSAPSVPSKSSAPSVPSKSSAPSPATCELCRDERKHHECGHLSLLHSIPCAMLQPGNGPFTLRQGGILVGEACPPGFVIHSQDTFLQLYERIKKVMSRGGEVRVEVREEMA